MISILLCIPRWSGVRAGKLFPQAKLAIGPAVENGFYYDFDLTDGHAFTEEDLVKIEEEMKNIVKQNLSFEKYVIPDVEKQIADFKAKRILKKERSFITYRSTLYNFFLFYY